jgi:two-component system sensor histidine kinase KdpD
LLPFRDGREQVLFMRKDPDPHRRVGLAARLGNTPYSLLASLVLVGAITATLTLLDRLVSLTHVSIVYLVPVVIAATQFGIVAAVVAAVAGLAASAFFFYPPIYSLQVADPQHLLELPLFVFVAIVTGHLASRLRGEAALARERERTMRDLYAFSRKVASAYAAKDIYAAIEEHLSSIVQRRVVLFETGADAVSERRSTTPADLPDTVRSALSSLAKRRRDPGGTTVFDPDSGNTWLLRTISRRTPEFGLMAINLGAGSSETIGAVKERVDAIWGDVVTTLERLDLGQAITEAKTRAETDLLREALIGSVSHELKTPLAAILGAATVLRQAPSAAGDGRIEPLTALICDEAERLNADIQNLLDATRISCQGVRPHPEWFDPADIVNAVLERKKRSLGKHRVAVDVPEEPPLLYADPVMIEQALGQIIDNAAKYSDAGSTITLALRCEGARLSMSVADRGFGLTTEEQQRLWERFFRGRGATTVSGSGLGLWIAQAFVAANGGTTEAFSPGAGRGSVVSIHLPVSALQAAGAGANAHA